MKKYAAIIFATEPEAIDIMIDKFRNTFDVNIIFFKTSYDKLWITAEPKPKEANNND